MPSSRSPSSVPSQYAHTLQGVAADTPPPTWAVVHRSFANERQVTEDRDGANEDQAILVRPGYHHRHHRRHQQRSTPTSPPEGGGLLAQEPSPPWAAASAVLTATCVAVLLAKFIRRRRRPRPLRPPRLGRSRGWAALRKVNDSLPYVPRWWLVTDRYWCRHATHERGNFVLFFGPSHLFFSSPVFSRLPSY